MIGVLGRSTGQKMALCRGARRGLEKYDDCRGMVRDGMDVSAAVEQGKVFENDVVRRLEKKR